MTPTDVDYAHTRHASESRSEKALTLARLAWRYGLAPVTFSSFSDSAQGKFCKLAAVNRPSPGSPTWTMATDRLQSMWDRASSPAAPPQDLLGEREEWMPLEAVAQAAATTPPRTANAGWQRRMQEAAVAVAALDAAAPEEAIPAAPPPPREWGPPNIPADAPDGWADRTRDLPPLGAFHCLRCPRPAVFRTMDDYRCPEHPPIPGEWGARLSYARNPDAICLPNHCWCGTHLSNLEKNGQK